MSHRPTSTFGHTYSIVQFISIYLVEDIFLFVSSSPMKRSLLHVLNHFFKIAVNQPNLY